MPVSRSSRFALVVALLALASSSLLLPILIAQTSPDPWAETKSLQAADLLKELNDSKSPPIVLFVGFKRLYTSGHIKGAQFHGTGGNPEGLKEIAAWAGSLPRTTNLVIYCGCCPMEHCPNIRPAYTQLAGMGFTKLRVLVLPTSFAVDWADKGYAYEKGQ
jgi:hypothetical protein